MGSINMNDQLLIPILAFVTAISLGGAALIIYTSRKTPLRARLQRLKQGGEGAEEEERKDPMLEGLVRMGTMVSSGDSSKDLKVQLTTAGFHHVNAAAIYLGAKMLLFLFGLVGAGVLVSVARLPLTQGILLVFLGATTLFFIPNLYVDSCRRDRRARIKNQLPDVIDLLEICVSGGMGLDMAWNSVAQEFRHLSPLLADEMALTNLEMHLGGERGDAMRHMAERTGADEMLSLVAVLVQTERFGTSVGEALRVFAANMREIRSQRAEESAEKMALKMLFPLTVLIFPVVLIVAIGPAGITLTELFSG